MTQLYALTGQMAELAAVCDTDDEGLKQAIQDTMAGIQGESMLIDLRDRDGLTVRVIEYRMPGVPNGDQIYRLVTTILDARAAPAREAGIGNLSRELASALLFRARYAWSGPGPSVGYDQPLLTDLNLNIRAGQRIAGPRNRTAAVGFPASPATPAPAETCPWIEKHRVPGLVGRPGLVF